MTTPRVRNNPRLRELPKDQHVIAGGNKVAVSDSFARPANTTAYTALDEISDTATAADVHPLHFTGVGKSGYIVGARITTDQAANTEVFRLHLYRNKPAAWGDNVEFGNLFANNPTRIGQLTFTAAARQGSTNSTAAEAVLVSGDDKLPMPYVSPSGDLYGLLNGVNGFTPASGQRFFVELIVEQD